MTGLTEFVRLFAEIDAAVFGLIALGVGLMAFTRKQRPFALSRAMDVAISTMLFIMLGLRYGVLAVLTLIFPQAVLGDGMASAALPSIIAACYAVGAVVGLATHRLGEVRARVIGAVVLLALTVLEAIAATFVLDRSVLTQLDTLLSVVLALGTCVCAAYFWTYRTAVPDPLGGDKRPLDY